MIHISAYFEAVEAFLARMFGIGRHIDTGAERVEPVEIRLRALREIAGRVQPTGRGGYYFPFHRVVVTLHSESLSDAFVNPQFEMDVQAELKERGCERVSVPVEIRVNEATGTPYQIDFQAAPTAPPKGVTKRPEASLHVIEGSAAMSELHIAKDRIYIGRMAEVRQRDGTVVRRNDLPFDDSETSVARKHAWIQYSGETGKFRVFNDPECAVGTNVFRDGVTLPSDSQRGVELCEGDEIHMGRARVRFDARPQVG